MHSAVKMVAAVIPVLTKYPPLTQELRPGHWRAEAGTSDDSGSPGLAVELKVHRAEWRVKTADTLVVELVFDLEEQSRLGRWMLRWPELLGDAWFGDYLQTPLQN